MKKEIKKKIIDVITFILGLLTALFMCLKIYANLEWAFYAEIGVVIPFWAFIIAQIVIFVVEKNETKK